MPPVRELLLACFSHSYMGAGLLTRLTVRIVDVLNRVLRCALYLRIAAQCLYLQTTLPCLALAGASSWASPVPAPAMCQLHGDPETAHTAAGVPGLAGQQYNNIYLHLKR